MTAALTARGFSGVEPQLLQIEPPRAWGVATNVCFMLAGRAAAAEVERETAGLSKGDAKKRASEITRSAGERLAREIAAELALVGRTAVSASSVGRTAVSGIVPGRTAVSGIPAAHFPSAGELSVYRRHMPHWRLPGSVYFVTWRLAPSQPPLSEQARDIVLEALRFFAGERYRLYAWVVMDDHVHVLVQPLEALTLEEQVRRWKSITAHRLQRECGYTGSVWHNEYMDRIMRDEEEFWEKAQYIVNNPLKRWPELEDYPWFGWNMEGGKGWVNPADAAVSPTGDNANAADTAVSPTGELPFVREVAAEGAYINFYYDAAALAAHVVDTVLAAQAAEPGSFGRGAPVLLPDGRRKRIMVEYAQPNTHKDFHVGHLRNASIGQAIANLLEFAGNEVLKATYIGDVGKHVANAIIALKLLKSGELLRIAEFYNDYIRQKQKDLLFSTDEIENLYKIGLLVDFEISALVLEFWSKLYSIYSIILNSINIALGGIDPQCPSNSDIELSNLFDKLNDLSSIWLKNWETEDEATRGEWQDSVEACVSSLVNYFAELNLDINPYYSPDCWFYESTIDETKLGQKTAEELKQLGIATIDTEGEYAGALYVDFAAQADAVRVADTAVDPTEIPVFTDAEKKRIRQLGKMTILRSDGTSLYQTKELGLAKYKFDNFDIHESLYVVGAEQKLYFEQVFAILRLWGFPNAEHCKHISYELVVLPTGKMSSREGNIVSYRELRDEAVGRALKITQEKGIAGNVEQTARDVAIAAIKYAMLAVTGAQQITFDFEQALSFDGRSAPYLQYAYARTRKLVQGLDSVGPTAVSAGGGTAPGGTLGTPGPVGQASGLPLMLNAGETPAPPQEADTAVSPTENSLHPAEVALARAIARFPAVVQEAAAKYEPATVCTYLYDIAGLFAEFYRDCRVLDAPEPERTFRRRLTLAFRTIMATGFKLLALPLPEEM